MSLDLNFLEKGTKKIQHLGDLNPGELATFAGYGRDDEPVVYALSCLTPTYRELLDFMIFGKVFVGDESFVLDGVGPGKLNNSNLISNIAFGSYWCQEVVSDEHEAGLLLARHIPDLKADWSLS